MAATKQKRIPGRKTSARTKKEIEKRWARNTRSAQRLISQILNGEDQTLVQKVAHTLNQYPKTRDSDITLTIKLLQTFYPDYIDEEDKIHLYDLYDIPKFYDMQRIRAKIQNDYGLFLASPEVRAFRQARQMSAAEHFAANQPDFSPVFVFADESGKREAYLVLGSIWVYSAVEYHRILKNLSAWRSSANFDREFHFRKIKDVSRSDLARSFFSTFLETGYFSAFKALVIRNSGIPANRRLSAVYEGFAEMLINGLQSEFNSNRISPPTSINLLKDADPDTDILKLVEMNRRLRSAITTEFPDGRAKLNEISAPASNSNDLIQMADLFTGALSRWLNQGVPDPTGNPKDRLAFHIGSFFEWTLTGNGQLSGRNDVCSLIYL